MTIPTIISPSFTYEDSERAFQAWGANCGPGALAAITRKTLEEVRPHLVGFEKKGYTNPTMMYAALDSLGITAWTRVLRGVVSGPGHIWPSWGLVRIQWEGPWTKPGVPIRARYRHTHWIGAATIGDQVGVFDINCMNNGTGWVLLADWERDVVPFILAECVPRASGRWHQTHVIEVTTVSGEPL